MRFQYFVMSKSKARIFRIYRMNATFAFSLLLSMLGYFLLGVPTASATDSGPGQSCSDMLDPQGSKGVSEKIESIYRSLRQTVIGQKSPFESDRLDPNVIGKAHLDLGHALSIYKTIYDKRNQVKESAVRGQAHKLSVSEFERLFHEVKDEVDQLNPASPPSRRFALMESLRLLQVLESNIDHPLPETSLNESQEQMEKEDQKNKDNAKEDEPEKDQPFEWGDTPDKYSPENKDVNSQKGNSQVIVIVKSEAITNNRRYPRQIYDVVNGHGFFPAHLSRTRVQKSDALSQSHQKILHLVKPHEKKYIKNIPVPDGYYAVAGEYKGYSVREIAPQEYSVLIKTDLKNLPAEISIPIMPIESYRVSAAAGLSVYSAPTGIPTDLWPNHLLNIIKELKAGKKTNLQVAEVLREHFTGPEYIYFSKGSELNQEQFHALKRKYEDLKKKYPKPIAMAVLKSMNCDGAAWIGAAMLRDFFAIPTRVIGGETAQQGLLRQGSQLFEVVTNGTPQHAWLEVWDELSNRWVPVDMTPQRNSPQSSSDQLGLPLESRKEQEEKQKSNQNQSHNQNQNQTSDLSDKPEGEEQKRPFETRVADEMKRSGPVNVPHTTSKAQEQNSQHEHQASSVEKKQQGEEVNRRFETRKLKSKTVNEHDRLVMSLVEAFYAYHLRLGFQNSYSPSFHEQYDRRLTEFLEIFHSIYNKAEYQTYYLKRMDLVAGLSEVQDQDLISRLRNIGNFINSGKLREAWLDLRAIEAQMDELKKLTTLMPSERDFYEQLLVVLREFQQVKHPDSGSFDLADRLYKKLPGHLSRQLLKSKYPHMSEVGHLDAQSLSSQILSGHETDLVRMAMAGPYVQLFLNSERKPQYSRVKTFDRSYNPNDPRDVVRTRRISDFPRMILEPNPGEHLFAKTLRGEQLAVAYNETRRVPNPKAMAEHKVSVLYYDVSGSMGSGVDSPLAVQDALIMAFIDKALSESDLMGRPIHKVYILPFDDQIGDPLEITTREEAMQLISLQRIAHKTKGRGGTEIQPVLMDFYDKVALAYDTTVKKSKNPHSVLKKANLVLFSDGGREVNYAEVKKRQDEISALTGVQMHLSFVAIGAENQVLKDLATGVTTKTTHPTYFYIDPSNMDAILNGSDFAEKDPQAFAFNEKDNVSGSVIHEFQKLRDKAILGEPQYDFSEYERILSSIRVQDDSSTANDHGSNSEAQNDPQIGGANTSKSDAVLLSSSALDLRDVMNFVISNREAPWGLKLALVDTALNQYIKSIGSRYSKLTPAEHRILNQLVRMRRIKN